MARETNLILLSGANPEFDPWIEQVAESLNPLFASTTIRRPMSGGISVPGETHGLLGLARSKEPFDILAHSVGTWVALHTFKRNFLITAAPAEEVKPQRAIFIGTPIEPAHLTGFPIDELLQDYHIPTLFIQETDDPTMSYKGLVRLVEERNVSNHTTIEVPGDNHHYEDVVGIHAAVADFIAA